MHASLEEQSIDELCLRLDLSWEMALESSAKALYWPGPSAERGWVSWELGSGASVVEEQAQDLNGVSQVVQW